MFATGGVYVNYMGTDSEERRDSIRAVYPPELYAELARIKQRYDPGNFFRLNHNIRPAADTPGVETSPKPTG